MRYGRRPLLVLVLIALTTLAVILDVGSPLQPLLVGLFLVAAPGTAVLVQARGWPPLVLTMAILSTSLSIDVLLSTALFYAGWWSPAAVLSGLVGVCLIGTAAGLRWAPPVRP